MEELIGQNQADVRALPAACDNQTYSWAEQATIPPSDRDNDGHLEVTHYDSSCEDSRQDGFRLTG
jgi:hypothetical protein